MGTLLSSGSICIFHPVAPGSNPRHWSQHLSFLLYLVSFTFFWHLFVKRTNLFKKRSIFLKMIRWNRCISYPFKAIFKRQSYRFTWWCWRQLPRFSNGYFNLANFPGNKLDVTILKDRTSHENTLCKRFEIDQHTWRKTVSEQPPTSSSSSTLSVRC